MKVLLIALAAFAAAILFWFCKHNRYTPGNFPDHQIRWGHGGGFAGKETTYTLLENGQIFELQMGRLVEQSSTKKRTAKSVLKTTESIGLATLDFKHPSNIYQFIEVLSGDAVQRISWGDPKHPVNADIQALYDRLEGLVKK